MVTSVSEPSPEEAAIDEKRLEDESYLKGYFNKMETDARSPGRNPTVFVRAMTEHLKQAHENFCKSTFSTTFFRSGLMKFVIAVTERAYTEVAWVDEVNVFLYELMRVSVALIRDGSHNREILRAVDRVLWSMAEIYRCYEKLELPEDSKDAFYPEEGTEGEDKENEEGGKKKVKFVEVQRNDRNSPHYLSNVTIFGELGGFDAFISRITNADHKLPCKDMMMFLKLVDQVKPILNPSFLATYTVSMYEAVHQHILSFPSSDYREQSLEDIIETLNAISKMAEKVRDYKLVKEIEMFKFEMSFTYLQLPYFEARLKGIENITHMIKVALGEAPHNSSKNSQGSGSGNSAWQKSTTVVGNPLSTALGSSHRPMGPVRREEAWKDEENYSAPPPLIADDSEPTSTTLPSDDSSSSSTSETTPSDSSSAPSESTESSESSTSEPTENGKAAEGPEKPVRKTPLSVDCLLQLVDEKDIINKVLKLGHPEALKQGSKIIQFVAKERNLSDEVLESIWNASNLHESLQVVVFKAIIDLLECIPSVQIDFFYDRIMQLPSSSYNAQVLTFIGDFTKRALKVRADRNDEEKLYGLEIFWKLLLSSHQGQDRTTNAIVNETVDHLEKLLSDHPSQREVFLGRCLENLRSATIVEVSLTLLKKILGSFKDVGVAITDLEEKENLVDTLLSEMEKSVDPSETAVKSHLSFLEFILTQSNLMISVEQATRLWDCITKTEHATLAYQWFESAQHPNLESDPYGPQVTKFPAFSPIVTETLFAKMADLDYSALCEDGLKMYRRFFLSVNAKKRKLRRLGENEFRVCDFDLTGLDRFWSIGIWSKDPTVALMALSYLRKIYENVSLKLIDVVSEERGKFILKCMGYILDAKQVLLSSTSSDEEKAFAKERMGRSASLVTSIITKDNKTRPSESIHELRFKEAIWRLEKKNAPKNDEAEGTQEAMDALRESDDKEKKLLDDFQGPVSFRPADLVSEKFFDELFGILPVVSMQDQIWGMLMSLPTNVDVLKAVEELTKEGDQFLFVKQVEDAPENQSIFRLLYLMQVIRSLLESEEWLGSFIEAGGLTYLVDIFSNKDLLGGPNGDFGKQTMSHLVDTLNQLFSSGKLDQEKLISCLSNNFVLRLMGQISELAVKPPEEKKSKIEVLKIEEPETGTKKGTRIANCHYSAKEHVLSFDVEGSEHYQVSCYCVDYNTDRRIQKMVAWLGDDKKDKEEFGNFQNTENASNVITLKGPSFHNGQWVVWDVHGAGRFNITIASESGPNWVLSSFLLDKSPNPDAPASPFPTLLEIDSQSQGKWRGKYGSCGGVLLGVKDFKVPAQPGIVAPFPRLEAFDTKKCDRYEWINSLTSDPRAMQQAPTVDEIDAEVDDETEVTPLPTAKEVTRVKMEGGEHARSTETSRSLLSLLVASSLDRDDLLNAVVTYPELKEWLFTCLIQCDDQKLRESVVEGIERLCSKSSCNDCFLDCLLGFLKEVEKEQAALAESHEEEGSPKCFTEYFSLLLCLLKRREGRNSEEVLGDVYRMLRNHVTLEEDDKSDTDTVLLGYLELVAFLLEGNYRFVESQDVVRDIFHDCLFGVQESRHAPKIPKCRTKATREAGYNLLVVATKQAPCVHTKVMGLLSDQLAKSTLPVDWNIDVFEKSTEERTERTRYVGLKNQGCTCYLNSLIQQLFIIPSLRNDIMNVQVPQDKDNIMYQLQSLFAYMQESRAKYVDTIDFCRTVKLMGQPIVMSRQEDANEFFNSLADQVEPYLKGTPQEHLFKDTFGGKIMSQIISQECPHQSESPQDFLTISLKVQSKRDIYESLDFYVQADMLDGDNKWKCEACNKHVAAKKRACIQHLPNTLALHLIRFEFDYQTFNEVKVNDRFEFPIATTLNMKPYTKEGIAAAEGGPVEDEMIRSDDYYEYELVGVLIHSGTAHSGHYYSYIRERVTEDGSDPRWFEFNDRDVTEFRRENLENQAFGGKFNESYGTEKSYSGYMLFYERKNTYEPNKYSVQPLHMGSVALDVSQEKTVEPAILDTIWKDGLTRFHQKLLMTAPTFEFIWSTVSLLPPFEPVLDYEKGLDEEDFTVQVMCFATKFLMDVLSHCMDNIKIIDKIKHLTTLYEKHAPMAGWLLSQMACPDNVWMKNTLSFCHENDMRTAFAELMCTCIKLIAPYEQKYYFEREPVLPGTAAIAEEAAPSAPADKGKGKEEADEKEPPMQPKSVVVRFINRLTALLTAAADKASRTIQQMLYVLLIFARVGSQEKQILMNKNAVNDLIALFELYRHSISGGNLPTDRFVYLIELLGELVCGCDNPAHLEHQGEEGVPAPTGMKLREENLKKLFDRAFLISVLRQSYLVGPMTPIFKHWVWGQTETSNSVIRGICYVMDSLYKGREAVVELIFELLELRDPGYEERIRLTATLLINLVRTNNRLENFRNAFTDLIFSVCKNQPIAREHTITSGGLFELVEKFPEVHKFVITNHKEAYEEMLAERVEVEEEEGEEEGEDQEGDDGMDVDDEKDKSERVKEIEGGTGMGGGLTRSDGGGEGEGGVDAGLQSESASSALLLD